MNTALAQVYAELNNYGIYHSEGLQAIVDDGIEIEHMLLIRTLFDPAGLFTLFKELKADDYQEICSVIEDVTIPEEAYEDLVTYCCETDHFSPSWNELEDTFFDWYSDDKLIVHLNNVVDKVT
ncbi:MAG: hypothetical protein EOM65_07780, partial [Synergistales bacterium]|nr:hypothetical protein [Synergistales bacterium]